MTACIKAWDKSSGQLLNTLVGHTSKVNAIAITEDGSIAASGSEDHSLKVWNLSTAKLLSTYASDTNVEIIRITPDNQRIIFATRNATIGVLNASKGEIERNFKGIHFEITLDGQRLVSALDGKLGVWNLATGIEERTIHAHSEPTSALAISPDGQTIVSCTNGIGGGGNIKVSKMTSSAPVHISSDRPGSLISIKMIKDQPFAVFQGGKEFQVWDLSSRKAVKTLGSMGNWNYEMVAISPDGKHLIISDRDRYIIQIWNCQKWEDASEPFQ